MYRIVPFLLALSTSAPLLAAEEEMPSRGGEFFQTMIIIGIALVFFYLILWRPEQKRRREMETKRDSLKVGDKVTAMGIIGTVSKVGEHTVILKMVDGAKVEFLKAAVTDVLEPGKGASEEA